MSENLRRFVRTVYTLDAVVNRVDPQRWDDPSPCPEWTAREVLGHALSVVGMVGAVARGEEREMPAPATAAGEDPATSWARSRDDTLAVLDTQGTLHAERDTPWGRIPVDQFLGGIYVDTLTHAWDLARATGEKHGIAPDLAVAGEAMVARIGDSLRAPGRMDEPVGGDWADPVDSFIAFTGRRP